MLCRSSQLVVVLLALLLLAALPIQAERLVQCSNVGSRTQPTANCAAEHEGAGCAWWDATLREKRTGQVVYRAQRVLENGVVLPAGYYCKLDQSIDGGEGVPLCHGGEVLFFEDEVVGCRYRKFDETAQQLCQGNRILRPSRWGSCWVCVQEPYVELIRDRSSWQFFEVATSGGKAKTANFSCLTSTRFDGVTEQPSRHLEPRPALEHVHFEEEVSPCSGTWTAWLNRDTPGGSGDFETLRDFLKSGQACSHPTAVECRVRRSGKDWRSTGEDYRCEPSTGGVCVNREQSNGSSCSDYEVRFCCT